LFISLSSARISIGHGGRERSPFRFIKDFRFIDGYKTSLIETGYRELLKTKLPLSLSSDR